MYKRKTKLSPIHISLIALAILVVIAVIVTFAVKKDEPKEPTTQSGIIYDDSAIEGGWETLSQEEIEQRLNDKVQAGMINISCNTAPYFKDGKSEGNVMLVNELNNLYPQKVEFYRNDTGEKILRVQSHCGRQQDRACSARRRTACGRVRMYRLLFQLRS